MIKEYLIGRIETLDVRDNRVMPGTLVGLTTTALDRTGYTTSGVGTVVAVTGLRVHVMWAIEPDDPINTFAKFAFPVAQKVNYYSSIARSLVHVQPMTSPVGSIFYLDYKYGNTSGSI